MTWLHTWVGVQLLLAIAPRPAAASGVPAADGAGRPIVRNYDHRDFGAEVQNWDVLQDASGLVYFANNAGVLEFDGRTWRVIQLPSHLGVRSLARDTREGGRIYVGAMGDFGVLQPDDAGQLQFESLLPPEARRDRRFNEIIDPVFTTSGIYFALRQSICRWFDGQLRCRDTQALASRIFAAGDGAFVQQRNAGLMQIVDSTVTPVPGGERFTHDDVTFVVSWRDPYGRQRLLVGTRGFGLYVQSGESFEPFGGNLRDRHREDQLLGAAVLDDGSLALATRLRGVLVIDAQGRLRQQIDRAAGLMTNHVHALWPDQQGGLWVALQSGISRIELSSPFSIFNEASGLEPEWREIIRHRGVLYVRGYKGLFASNPTESRAGPHHPQEPLRFRRVVDLEPPVWSFALVGDRLLVTSGNGVHEVGVGYTRRIATYTSTPMSLYAMRGDGGRVYVGLADGLASLQLVDGAWRNGGRVNGVDETITSIAEGPGYLWLVARNQRIIRVRLDRASSRGSRVSGGLESGIVRLEPETLTGRVAVRYVADRAVFLNEDGIVEFDESVDEFVPVAALDSLLRAGRRSFSGIAEDAHGNLWVASRKPGGIDLLWKQPDGTYTVDNTGLRQIPVWSIYPDPEGSLVWFCTPDYLLRYDPSIRTRTAEFATLIRKVTAGGDTTIHGGVVASASAPAHTRRSAAPALPSSWNSVRFEFSAPRFDDAERNEFQSHLEGFDSGWSSWGTEGSREYTNLPPGRYTFRARGRDVHGQLGDEAVFAFTILPPWYRTVWAHAVYLSLFCVALVAARRVYVRRACARREREREHLELEKLRELDRMKSRFFADVSHEFRTPISLILGPVGQMLRESPSPEYTRRLTRVRHHAEYLLRLISQFLDLSKLESRKMPLHARPGELFEAVAEIVGAFGELCASRGVHLSFERPAAGPVEASGACWFDRDVLEKILNNLLSNALKFTPEGGSLCVRARRVEGIGRGNEDAFVELMVADSGTGIAPEHLSRIFDRFYQADETAAREGFGIGLALVKELADLHRGSVRAESAPGKGTRVFVRLAVGPHQFSPYELSSDAGAEGTSSDEESHAGEVAPGVSVPAALASVASSDADCRTTVLIVEDHAELRTFLREQLQPYYRVVEARDGSEGLAQATALLPGLVLSDVMMRKMDGFELCRALKTNGLTSHIPVVLLTARVGREDRLLGLDTGADCYIVKPFDPPELIARIRNLIEQRRLLRERFSSSVVLKPSEVAVAPADQAFLARLLDEIQSNLGDPDFDVEQLGRAVGLSRSQLHRRVRALTKQPPTMLIRSIRLERAADLLARRAGSVAEIAYSVGFSSQAYFAKCFREQFHTSPREYREARHESAVPPAAASPESHTMRHN